MFTTKKVVLSLVGLIAVTQVYAGDHCRVKQRRALKQQVCCTESAPVCYTPAINLSETCCVNVVGMEGCACDGTEGGIASVSNFNEPPIAPAQHSEIGQEHSATPPTQTDGVPPQPITEEQRKAEEELRRNKDQDGVKLAPPQQRIWTDSTGSYHVMAELRGVDGDSVLLLKENGKSVRVPVERLSLSDRLYVKSLASNANSVLVSHTTAKQQ